MFRGLLPHAERRELLSDLAIEYAERASADGPLAARAWLWRQLLGSLPALLRRTWWRGWTGFEPRANRMHPGGPMLESWISSCPTSSNMPATFVLRSAQKPAANVLLLSSVFKNADIHDRAGRTLGEVPERPHRGSYDALSESVQ